ncbi:MAG: hypothetical protein SGI71_04200 [Verrucomicrobiota bacterium]|nr:hypothetical protein [Verrucomicrobiota bacterium]
MKRKKIEQENDIQEFKKQSTTKQKALILQDLTEKSQGGERLENEKKARQAGGH